MAEYYMVIERDESGWYVGSIPELPGCHTQGRTIKKLTARMREAINLYLEDSGSFVKKTVYWKKLMTDFQKSAIIVGNATS